MNNKLFARIAAAAISASMLSTFVFADGAPTIADNKLSFMNGDTNIISVPDGAEYVTMMSYLITAEQKTEFETNQTIPTPVDTNIIALDQVAKADVATQLSSVNILAEKLDTTNPAAIVRVGNSLGTGNTWVVALNSTGTGYTITFIAGLGTLTGENTVTSTDGKVTAITEVPTTTKAGIKFKHWATKDAAGAYTKFDFATATVSADTELYAVYEITVGDVDLNGSVTTSDAGSLNSYTATRKAAVKNTINANASIGAKYKKADGTQLVIGDVDLGGTVTTADAGLLNSYTATRKAAVKNTINQTASINEKVEVVEEVK